MHRSFRQPPTGSLRPARGFRGGRRAAYEPLEPRLPLSGEPVYISEFLAANSGGLRDYAGDAVDWIELHNDSAAAVDLAGWHLTDDADDLAKWSFPASPASLLPAGGRLLVFASDKAGHPGVPAAELHANFKLDRLGEFLALVEPDGVTLAHVYAPQFPEQLTNVSYGVASWSGVDDGLGGVAYVYDEAYFQTPTPGAANESGALGTVAPVAFSVERGFFAQPFTLTISSPTPDAAVRFTTDGSPPTATTGTLYQAPIPVASTATIRAAAFKPGHVASPVATHTYLFLGDVLKQSRTFGKDGSGLPPFPNWGHLGGPGDWQVDPDIVQHADPADRLTTADLQTIPTLSLTLPWNDMFGGGGQGIYIQGELVEKGVSVEQILPDGTTGFQIDASVQIVGGTSTDRWKSDKLSMRLKFASAFGPSKLAVPLFGAEAADEFDTLVLDATLNFSWTHPSTSQTDYAKFIQDQHVANLQLAAGGYAPRARYHHLYVNGLYWGLYYVHERPDESFAASYLGGDKEDYDVVKHRPDDVVNGSNASYNELLERARANLALDANYQQVAALLDLEDFVDYMLVNFYVGNTDWAHQNWYATFNREDPAGRWRFHSWDAEKGHDGVNVDVTGKNNAGGPTEIHQQLMANAEYRLLFADHVQRHFFNGGVMTPASAAASYLALMNEVDRAIVGESARWGDNRVSSPYTRSDWLAVQHDLLANYFPRRTNIVLNQLRERDLFPSPAAEPPSFRVAGVAQHGGAIPPGAPLSLLALPGTTYYTLDGTDPRLPGGAVAPGAVAYAGPIDLTYSTDVKARLLTPQGEWSALNHAYFTAGAPPLPHEVAVTEAYYHPAAPTSAELAIDPGLDDNDFEFLEISNLSDRPLSLANASFVDGVQFGFPASAAAVLPPGGSLVVVNRREAFALRFGDAAQIVGEFADGQLANSGETLRLVGADGNLLWEATYDDAAPWPTSPDGGGDSLQLRYPRESPEAPHSWYAAAPTPGTSTLTWPTPGDANYDERIDGRDLLAWQRGFGGGTRPSTGDFALDGHVDGADLAVWEAAFGAADSAELTAAAVLAGPQLDDAEGLAGAAQRLTSSLATSAQQPPSPLVRRQATVSVPSRRTLPIQTAAAASAEGRTEQLRTVKLGPRMAASLGLRALLADAALDAMEREATGISDHCESSRHGG